MTQGPSRRRILQFGLAVPAVSGIVPLAACAPEQPLRVALHRWPGYEFLRLAHSRKLLSPATVMLEATSGLADSVSAIRDGKVDAAGLTLDEVISLRAAGTALSVVLVFNVSVGADVLLARPEITTMAGLRNMRIGVEGGSLGTIMLKTALDRAGLSQDEVRPVVMGGDHVAAWSTGDLDAIITHEPAFSRLRSRGLRRLFDSSAIPQLIVDVLAVRQDLTASRGDSLRAAVAGHFAALDLWRTNPIDTAYYLAPLLGVEPDAVEQQFVGLDLPDIHANRAYLSADATALSQAAREISEILGIASSAPGGPAADLYSAEFLPAGAG